jgi:hypothetical protein
MACSIVAPTSSMHTVNARRHADGGGYAGKFVRLGAERTVFARTAPFAWRCLSASLAVDGSCRLVQTTARATCWKRLVVGRRRVLPLRRPPQMALTGLRSCSRTKQRKPLRFFFLGRVPRHGCCAQ